MYNCYFSLKVKRTFLPPTFLNKVSLIKTTVYNVFKAFKIPKTINIVVAPKFSTSAGPRRLVIITNVNSEP